MDLGISRIVRELGSVEAMGRVPDELEDVPEVLPVTRMVKQETGEGGETALVEEIPFNLSSLRKHLAQVNLSRRVLTTDLASRQKFLEESVYTVAVERMKREAEHFDELGLGGEMDKAMKSERLQKWMWEWHGKLMERLKVDIEGVIEKEKSFVVAERQMVHRLGPFLSLLKPEKLSLITILELMRLHGTGGVSDGMKTARALLAVGRAVELEYKATLCRRAKISIPSTISALSSGTGRPGEAGYFSGRAYEDLYKRRVAARRWVEDGEEWAGEWTQVGRVKVGSFLVDCLMDVAVVERKGIDKRTGQEVRENQPAFFHSYEYLHGHKLGVIKLNQVVAERLAKDGLRDTLHPRHLPMLIKPKPWLSHTDGGYLYNKTVAMRFKDSMEQESYLKHASSLGNLELVYAGLDVLGSTPWKINRGVFDVVLQVWNKGDRMGKIPPAVYDAPEPEPIEGMECDPKSKNVFMQRQKAWAHGKANNHSDRCSVNYRIEIARAFLGDTFYLPHNIDFRGRAYPIPPHLNHIGDDLSRGLLMFGEAKPLGERGLKWLKIHLANLYGYDKGSFDDRVVFVNERLEEIFDSAEKPLEGKGWWKKADDPWQCLAACKELHAALNSPDPLAYECALPVHQDGTCNGLQHYAALGGDEQGAKQVNLDVTDRPSDVYTYVAQMVEKRMLADIEKGDGGSAKFAKMLSGKVSRKVVKQTVMTTVYGVTFIGARDQIEKQLKDRGDLPEEECWLAASYLAKQVLLCIGNLFAGAKDIQNWLNLCARLISKSIPPERLEEAMSENVPQVKKGRVPKKIPVSRLRKEQMTSVVWTTPMGLPIVQPYRKTKRKQIMTALQTVFISDPNTPSEVNAVKQASAFPPNFIHSLDATHMMLTALQCRTRGLIFASVHDSYWTHACSVDEMSGIIRDTFIALHSSDVLRRLHAEFIERYKGYKIPLVSLKAGNLFKHVRASPSVPLSPETLEALAGEEATLDLSVSDRDVVVEDGDDVDALMEMEAEEEEEEEKPKGKKRGRKPKFDESMSDAMIAGKFVDLADVLPPLPEKGNFDVNTIKRSLYFFS
ncbi:hypothetical protein JAAARDRAFT_138907 [Jaapia argillacea MUCL 33604]|uniref:DNA-directed RNA polymerase n=1 Tax=Jaapia argillacea MUCL 33604 TaxID=933084 RepID=A0A067PF60_9AGAM|nr:hypothetical protein JAAARDRAFT_138907 [Jaapia argillacea MUCL 33604]